MHQAVEAIIQDSYYSFLTAAVHVEFHDMQLTLETWAELICLHFYLLYKTVTCFYACKKGKAPN
jgi:hypothetical protein